MIEVFFETDNGHTEHVASFEYEEDYNECFIILQKQSEKRGFTKVTERVVWNSNL